jgi:thiamine transporter ThiT
MGFRTKLNSNWRKNPTRTALVGFVVPLGVVSAIAGLVSGTLSGLVTGILMLAGTGWMILIFFQKD